MQICEFGCSHWTRELFEVQAQAAANNYCHYWWSLFVYKHWFPKRINQKDQLEVFYRYLLMRVCFFSFRLLWLLLTFSSSTCPVSNIYWEMVGWTHLHTNTHRKTLFPFNTVWPQSICLSRPFSTGLTELMTLVKKAVLNSLGGWVSVTNNYSWHFLFILLLCAL